MNHKRNKPRQSRAGCMLCKPHKATWNAGAARRAGKQAWRAFERSAQDGDLRADRHGDRS